MIYFLFFLISVLGSIQCSDSKESSNQFTTLNPFDMPMIYVDGQGYQFVAPLKKNNIKEKREPVPKLLKKMLTMFSLATNSQMKYTTLLDETCSENFNINNNEKNFVIRLLDITLKLKKRNDHTLSKAEKDNNFEKMIKAIQKNDYDLTQQCFFNINQSDCDSLVFFTPFIKDRCSAFLNNKNVNLVGFYFFELIPMEKRFIELKERCFNAMINNMADKQHITPEDKDYLSNYYNKKIIPLILAQDFAEDFDAKDQGSRFYAKNFDTKKYFLEFYATKENRLCKYVDESDVALYHKNSKSYIAISTLYKYGIGLCLDLGDKKIFDEAPEQIWSYYENVKKFFIDNWKKYEEEHKGNFEENFTHQWSHNSLQESRDKYFDVMMYNFLTKNSIETICTYKYEPENHSLDDQEDIKNEPTTKRIHHTMHTLLNQAAGGKFIKNNEHKSFYTILKHFYSHHFKPKALELNARWLHKSIDKALETRVIINEK